GKETNNLGVAINWADAGAADDQVTLEAFYLMKLLPFWELTPDVQVVANPAANPAEDQILIVGLRTRFIW
ncbi:MAG: carbohydrate porin, partial [Oleispira sp.]|nr:carbohydrate porin [Oleispira sp.]